MAGAQSGAAVAELLDGEGNPVGTADFTEGPEGVTISVNVVSGIEQGEHGIHIHGMADLSDPRFESAGGHFNPTGAQHGFENPGGPHAGDLENITVAADGTASYTAVNDRITLGEGQGSLFDEDGSALVIHSGPDDYQTDPAGDSGDRIAAGAIERATGEALADTGGAGFFTLAAAFAAMLAGSGALALHFRRSLI